MARRKIEPKDAVHTLPREKGEPYEMHFGDLVERVHFGAFAVLMTTRGALFETYTGYHVWTTPYSAGIGGETREKSLYAWLRNLVDFKKMAEGHEREPLPASAGGDGKMTKGEVLDTMKMMTEANLTRPMVIFTSADKATEAAVEHVKWLKEMAEKLQGSASGLKTSDGLEEAKALAEAAGDAERARAVGDLKREMES